MPIRYNYTTGPRTQTNSALAFYKPRESVNWLIENLSKKIMFTDEEHF